MYVLELAFDEDENERRMAARPEHRRLLAAMHADGRLLLAGPWDDDTGALLVFRTDRHGMAEIMAADPYYTTPGVRVAALRQWQPLIGDPSPPGEA